MNIDKMVDDLIKAQEAIGEPITVTRKTGVKDEIHNSCSGSWVDLIALQLAAISELFERLANDISNSESRALRSAILSTIKKDFDEILATNQPYTRSKTMKLKNIKVGDTVEVKNSIVDEPLNDKLEPNMLCKVTYVEPLQYEGNLTVRVAFGDDVEWVNHRHLRKPKTKVSVGDEFIITKSSSIAEGLNVGCKKVVVFVRDNGDSVFDEGYVMTAHKDGTFELEGIDVFLEKVDKPKQLTGSDLTRKMLADGETSVLCYIDDDNEEDAIKEKVTGMVIGFQDGWFRTNGIFPWRYAVPVPVEEVTPLSRWKHSNGNTYAVLLITNEHSENQDRYPTTVVYRDYDYKTWSKPLSDWHRSMTKMED